MCGWGQLQILCQGSLLRMSQDEIDKEHGGEQSCLEEQQVLGGDEFRVLQGTDQEACVDDR